MSSTDEYDTERSAPGHSCTIVYVESLLLTVIHEASLREPSDGRTL